MPEFMKLDAVKSKLYRQLGYVPGQVVKLQTISVLIDTNKVLVFSIVAITISRSIGFLFVLEVDKELDVIVGQREPADRSFVLWRLLVVLLVSFRNDAAYIEALLVQINVTPFYAKDFSAPCAK